MHRSRAYLGLLSISVLGMGLVMSGDLRAQDESQTDDFSGRTFATRLVGIQETPSILSPTTGSFRATVSDDGTSFDYTLSYGDFGTRTVNVAHIHIGQKGVAGNVTIFLCGGTTGAPPCPSPSGTVTGTVTAANVGAIDAQDLAAGDLDAVFRAIRRGVAYVNVHTSAHGGGEIRGQLRFLRHGD